MFSKIWLSKPHFENDDVDFLKKPWNLTGLVLLGHILVILKNQ